MQPALNVAFVAAYLLLLGLFAARYRRGDLDRERFLPLVGMGLTWLAYGLLQLSDEGPIRTGTPANYLVDGLSVACLLAGGYLLYRWWRDERGSDADAAG